MLPVVNRKKSRTRWRFHQKAGYRRKKKSLHASEQERSRCGVKGRALLQRAGFPLYNLSVSLRSTAPLVGEPLAKPFTLRGLPRPLPLGEVARHRRDGEGKPGTKEPPRSDRQALCRSDTIAVQSCLAASLPSQSGLRPPAPPKGEPLAGRAGFVWMSEAQYLGSSSAPLSGFTAD